MKNIRRTHKENSIPRMALAMIAVLLQILWVLLLFLKLHEYFAEFEIVVRIIAIFLAVLILGNQSNTAFKQSWIVVILAAPVFGLCIYFLFGNSFPLNRHRRIYGKLDRELAEHVKINMHAVENFALEDENWAVQSRYLSEYMGFPLYENSDIKFYGDTREAFEAQMEAIREAKYFIFLEYFAIQDAQAFAPMKELLYEKVKQGVEVRVLYDDVGSVGFVTPKFCEELQKNGVECRIFNRILPVIKLFLNNRDHRKIMIVDRKIAFTGGYNIADEYFNIVQPFGQWKDSGVSVSGDAVSSFTVMFLEMWNSIEHTDLDYGIYLEPAFRIPQLSVQGGVFIQPFSDTPLDDEYVGENVYLNMIACARDFAYISTPYITISEEMINQLSLAAKRGVDVRIVIPGIPDKKIVYDITKSYIPKLIYNGIKVYRYTPGFNHAKQIYVDGKAAMTGTINMDFRSFCHSFEDGVFWYGENAMGEIHKDFEEIFAVAEQITADSKEGRIRRIGLWQCCLRLIAPLI